MQDISKSCNAVTKNNFLINLFNWGSLETPLDMSLETPLDVTDTTTWLSQLKAICFLIKATTNIVVATTMAYSSRQAIVVCTAYACLPTKGSEIQLFSGI